MTYAQSRPLKGAKHGNDWFPITQDFHEDHFPSLRGEKTYHCAYIMCGRPVASDKDIEPSWEFGAAGAAARLAERRNRQDEYACTYQIVKIGATTSVFHRRQTLEAENPRLRLDTVLALVCSRPECPFTGNRWIKCASEVALQTLFKEDFHLRGEWFRYDPIFFRDSEKDEPSCTPMCMRANLFRWR